ncbi:ABC transporter ATP-binding protein [Nocardioides aquiterrae]|uniref:ABC transporter ATP-binding protein n=1 Tax=Nocardioides aquiterrae TaxID=203799 RepID=A0ABN1UDN7_9ACTN
MSPEDVSTAVSQISVRDVEITYPNGAVAVEDISLDVRHGEFLAILGPSGCGKSTLLQAVAGLLTPSRGEISIGGKPVTGAKNAHLPSIGYVFQEHRLLPWRTVEQNVELVLSAGGVPKAEWAERTTRYLSMLQIEHLRKRWPMQLSGGQRQRASISRALALEPSVVLMDEPFGTLDEVTARAMRSELLDVWQRTNRTFVFVTHSIREALFLADRVAVFTRGPARLIETIDIDLPRPRDYDSRELAALEGQVVARVLDVWGE